MSAILMWHTVRHLKPIQIANRIWRRFVRPRPDLSPAPATRKPANATSLFLPRPESVLGDDKFTFLNKTEQLSLPKDWNAPRLEKLWLYNLHYFDGLMSLNTPENQKAALIEKWVKENPVGHGNGWEPYPTSLRIANWIKWALSGGTLSEQALHSLAIQVRHLERALEYHLLGNHLLENIKALALAGLFFEGQEARRWRNKASKLLQQQQNEQILADGGHFELSPSYHALMLEGFLDICHAARLAGSQDFDFQNNTIARMLIWLKAMTRPDGKFPLFNDCAYGISPTYGELHTYASTLGFEDVETSTNDSTYLKNSGYVVKNTAAYSLFADVGNIAAKYLPGHTHNDIFNFEFFAHGQPVIVDTGTSTYEIGGRRSLERSTRSHNTVQFGDDEQNETWGGFRVGRRAKLSDIFYLSSGPSTKASGTAQHFSNNRHERIFMMAENTITIHDTADGLGAVARFHFHPDCDPEIQGDGLHVQNIHMTFSGCTSLNLVDYDYAPEFNIRKSAKVLEVAFEHTLETRITL